MWANESDRYRSKNEMDAEIRQGAPERRFSSGEEMGAEVRDAVGMQSVFRD